MCIITFLLLINMCCASEQNYHIVNLVPKSCLLIDKDSLSILSYIIQQKNQYCEDQYNQIRSAHCESDFYDCRKTILNLYFMSNTFNLKSQQEIYKGLLIISNALRHFPIRENNQHNAESFPKEIMYHIISYFSEYEIKKIGVHLLKDYFFQRRMQTIALTPISLLNHCYCISYSYLFELLKTLTFYKSNNNYYIGWAPFFVELDEHITPYIEAYRALIRNTDLEAKFQSDYSCDAITNPIPPHCSGKLLFLYFSGIHLAFGDFERHCTKDNILLCQKQIRDKASQHVHHSPDDKCIWCNLYRK